MNPIEGAWRRFRKSDHYALFKRSFEMQQSYLDFIGLKCLPPEIVVAGAVPLNLVLNRTGRAQVTPTDTSPRIDGTLLAETVLVNTVHVWAAYRNAKTIYEIDALLAECLGRSPWPEATPTAALRLPSRCPVLSVGGDGSARYLAAVYDLVTGAEHSGALELRISQLKDDLWLPISILHLTAETLSECANAAATDARSHGAPEDMSTQWQNDASGLALTILLYLAGEPDVVRIVHPGAKPVIKPQLERRDPERFRDLREPIAYRVGAEFRRAIERWEIEHADAASDPTGRRVRPHMRRAHSHLYWTGEGRKQPRVRFLLPISVRGGKLIEEPETPTIAEVK